MPKTTRRVLKAAQVALSDPLRLSLDPAAPAGGEAAQPGAAAPRVRLVQNHPEYAVIEVTCSCGKTTQVRCDYAAAAPAPVQEPAQG